jgi:hypothetical protein
VTYFGTKQKQKALAMEKIDSKWAVTFGNRQFPTEFSRLFGWY